MADTAADTADGDAVFLPMTSRRAANPTSLDMDAAALTVTAVDMDTAVDMADMVVAVVMDAVALAKDTDVDAVALVRDTAVADKQVEEPHSRE